MIFVIHRHGRKKFRAHNLASVWGGNCKFFLGGGKFPPPKMHGRNTDTCEQRVNLASSSARFYSPIETVSKCDIIFY